MELAVKDVHVTLGKAKIVNGVSLHVGERQSVGIIGPNGCGKSTLLKAIYRVNPIDSGEVLLNGQNVTKMSPKEAVYFEIYLYLIRKIRSKIKNANLHICEKEASCRGFFFVTIIFFHFPGLCCIIMKVFIHFINQRDICSF